MVLVMVRRFLWFDHGTDSDGDGINDGDEVAVVRTDPVDQTR